MSTNKNERPPSATGDGAGRYALHTETRIAVDTATAAHYLNRKPQTLRAWSCKGNGPLLPFHVHGRLAWRVEDLRKLMGAVA